MILREFLCIYRDFQIGREPLDNLVKVTES